MQNSDRSLEAVQQIQALHAHWIAANVLKDQYRVVASAEMQGFLGNESDWATQFAFALGSRSVTLMAFWYAALYVVIEGYKDLNLHDEEVDALLDESLLAKLRRFRNAIFHYQEVWISPKKLEFLEDAKSVDWVRKLHSEIGKCLLQVLKRSIPEDARAEMERTIEQTLANRPDATQQSPDAEYSDDIQIVSKMMQQYSSNSRLRPEETEN